VEETALLPMFRLVAPAATWGGVSRTRISSLAAGPALWSVADLVDESTSTLEYEGEGLRVDSSYVETPANAVYLAWEAEEQALVDALDVAQWSTGDCRYVTSVHGSSTQYYTGSTFDIVITNPGITSTHWWCPPEVLAAKAALEDHRKHKPQAQRYRYNVETTRLGWQRSTIVRPAVQFTIGSSAHRWALNGSLESYFLELGGGARDEWPSKTRKQVPVRPRLTCNVEGAPEGVRPYLGAWADDRFAVRFCYDGGALAAIVVATPEGNFVDAYMGEGRGLRPDGTLELSAAWSSSERPFYQKYRREGDTLVVRARSFESDWGPEQVLRPMRSELPFTELTATRNYGSATEAGFTDAAIHAELAVARGMLVETLMREDPALTEAFRADVLAHLRATLQGDELTRTLFLLGYPIEGDIPASVRLLDAWDRSVTEGRAASGRPWAQWSAGVR
ncbi:MAG: hypothetical protein Q8P18_12690, partial [Pseudomonadota bacterium]|nr:hypothetical protein [Pseudomonadota bacterium]